MVFGTSDAIRTHELERRSYQAWLQNAGLMRVSGLVERIPNLLKTAPTRANAGLEPVS